MNHPWETVDLNSDMGRAAFAWVRNFDPDITDYERWTLTGLLRMFNRYQPTVMNWQTTCFNLLERIINRKRIRTYNKVMRGMITDGGYPSIVEVVKKWQEHLMKHGRAMSFPPKLEVDTPEGRKWVVANYQAKRLCPSLLKNLQPGYEEIRKEYKRAVDKLRWIKEELDAFMVCTWPAQDMDKFRKDMTVEFPDCKYGLHEIILSIQRPLCQQALDAE